MTRQQCFCIFIESRALEPLILQFQNYLIFSVVLSCFLCKKKNVLDPFLYLLAWLNTVETSDPVYMGACWYTTIPVLVYHQSSKLCEQRTKKSSYTLTFKWKTSPLNARQSLPKYTVHILFNVCSNHTVFELQ